MNEMLWQAFIGASVTVVLAYMARRTQVVIETAAAQAAAKVDETKAALVQVTEANERKLDKIVQTGELVYALVNSAMGEQKRLQAVTARAKAEVTKDPVDVAAAELAEDQHRKHAAKQAEADAANKVRL